MHEVDKLIECLFIFQIAMRWRTEQEVVLGKGQFSCGNKHCKTEDDLHSWEVNFAYLENDEKKNALVKASMYFLLIGI